MEKPTERITTFLFFFMVFFLRYSIANHDVSAKIDFHSEEDKGTVDATTLKAVLDLDAGANAPRQTERTRTHTQKRISSSSSFRTSSGFVGAPLGTPLVTPLVAKAKRHNVVRDTSSKPLTVINNIEITVSGNESFPSVGSCEKGVDVCQVTSKYEEDKIITDVHLCIVTSLKPEIKVDDVPVINGYRGAEKDISRFHPVRPSRPHYFHDNNIPPVQSRFHHGNQRPFLPERRTYAASPPYWYYHHDDDCNEDNSRRDSGWKPMVDDKIEPPFSRTNLDGE